MSVHAVLGAFRMQLQVSRRKPDDLQVLLVLPVITALFLSVFGVAGRPELAPVAVLAPAVMALWTTALFAGGELIEEDRYYGLLEGVLATPASLHGAIAGRVAAIGVFGVVALVEAGVVARLLGFPVTIRHPGVFALTLLLLFWGLAGTALAMASAFVMLRSVRTWQNALSYPVYLLGGVVAPLAAMPLALRVPGRLFYLSWAVDLLRDSIVAQRLTAVGPRLAVLALLSSVTWVAGWLLLRRVVERMRVRGDLDAV